MKNYNHLGEYSADMLELEQYDYFLDEDMPETDDEPRHPDSPPPIYSADMYTMIPHPFSDTQSLVNGNGS